MHQAIQILIALAPALFLVASLIAGRFPGERSLERIASARARRPRAPRTVAPPARRSGSMQRRLQGGLLLAMHRATRPPPALLA